MTTFQELGLSDKTLKVLKEMNFQTPSDIQRQSIPLLLDGRQDFIGLAQTGTGKTAAFGLPLVERVEVSDKHTQALVLAPTRELGRQIAEQIDKFSKYTKGLHVLPVYGGAAIVNQIKALKKPTHIIIATPGRLIDLIKRKAVKLERLQYLVLDEADEMLNMGFKDELDEILSYTPADKQTWLFSATMAKEIKKIVKKYMDDPVEVKIDASTKVNANIFHQYVVVNRSDKMEALCRIIDVDSDMRGVVFCRTKRDTQELAEALLKRGYHADALHGDLSQQQRDRVMSRFKRHDLQVLIATDVAARGIDVDDLTHVFHYSLPDDDAYYTHRSGRTARAGKEGVSISFIGSRDLHRISRLEKVLDILFERVYIPSYHDIAESRMKQWCFGILETKTKGQVDDALLSKVNMVFGNLSKEELIAKIVAKEVAKLKLGDERDLNQEIQKSKHKSKGRDRKRRSERGRDRSRRRQGEGDYRLGDRFKKGKKKRKGQGTSKRRSK